MFYRIRQEYKKLHVKQMNTEGGNHEGTLLTKPIRPMKDQSKCSSSQQVGGEMVGPSRDPAGVRERRAHICLFSLSHTSSLLGWILQLVWTEFFTCSSWQT